MTTIVWLASYPRSGNTWTRAVLTNLQRRTSAPADINGLLPLSAASRVLFEDHVGVQAADLAPQQVEALRPAVYEDVAANATRPLFVKIHDANHDVADGRRLVPAAATWAAVYLVRNPLDVAVSLAAYLGRSQEDAIDLMNRSSFTLCGSPRRTSLRLPQRLGTWSSHVESWLDRSEFPVHVVRYEDLLRSPLEQFTAIARHSGIEASSEEIRRAVEFSRFEVLRGQELAGDFSERPPSAQVFFRSGREGAWQGALTPSQVDTIRRDHADVMKRLGYL